MADPICVVCGEPVDTTVSVFIRPDGNGTYSVAHARCEGGLARYEATRGWPGAAAAHELRDFVQSLVGRELPPELVGLGDAERRAVLAVIDRVSDEAEDALARAAKAAEAT